MHKHKNHNYVFIISSKKICGSFWRIGSLQLCVFFLIEVNFEGELHKFRKQFKICPPPPVEAKLIVHPKNTQFFFLQLPNHRGHKFEIFKNS